MEDKYRTAKDWLKTIALAYAVGGSALMCGTSGHPSADVYSGRTPLTNLERAAYGQAFEKLGIETKLSHKVK